MFDGNILSISSRATTIFSAFGDGPLGVQRFHVFSAASPCENSKQGLTRNWYETGSGIGSTVTMPDTAANQAVYPQQKQQKPGIGFPIARVIVVFSLAVGTAVEMTIGKYKGKLTGENSMFRELHKFSQAKDVIIADRAYAGWFDIALCVQR